MLADYLLPFFGRKVRRPLAVYGLLTGKKTISTLYAAFVNDQLQWLNLMPQLRRTDFDQQVAYMQNQGWLTSADNGVAMTEAGCDQQRRVAVAHPLPRAYDSRLNVNAFADRFFLAVQVESEASYSNNQYVPISAEWSVQNYVKRWYWHDGRNPAAFTREMNVLFDQLNPAVADYLADRFVGHNFAGDIELDRDTWGWRQLDALATLLRVLHAKREQLPMLTTLWGGLINPLPPLGQKSLELVNQGVSVTDIAQRIRRKDSTVNEHIQAAAIWGMHVEMSNVVPTNVKAALDKAWDDGARDYHELGRIVPDATFLQVRLVQVDRIRRARNE